MRKTLNELAEKTVSVKDYLMRMSEPFRSKFLERMETYALKKNVVKELRKHVDRVFVVVFSAQWCKDCAADVPVLALLADKVGLKVRVFGGLKKDPLNPNKKWRIPPSPAEVEQFEVEEIPYIIIFHVDGQELRRITEKPPPSKTIEEEILQSVKNNEKSENSVRIDYVTLKELLCTRL